MTFSNEFRIKFHWNSYNSNLIYNLLFKNCINVKGNVLLCGISNINLYKKFIEEHKNEILTLYIVDDEPCKWYVESLKKYFKNIYFININTFVKNDNMPKFDYIIQNPPYSGDTHLKFFEAGLNILKKDGKMIIIEPSTWLIQLKEGKYTKENSLAVKLKKRINGHVNKVIIENYNIQFRTDQYMPFSITYIDKSNIYNKFNIIICGEKRIITSIEDINLIGSYNIIKSIFNKIKNYDVVENHRYIPNKSEKINGNYYCKSAGIISGAGSQLCAMFDPKRSKNSSEYIQQIANNINWGDNKHDLIFENQGVNKHLQNYTSVLFHRYKNSISSVPLHRYDRGKHETEFEAECITGTKQELENWKYYVFNNSLPLFINICMTIDQHNNSLPYVPWIVDKKYTDQEIYDMFGFTDEEIKLIETTIKKYERYSPWFKRYICGPSSVSDEEVQKFIDKLENA